MSFLSRSIISVIANVSKAGISLISGMLIARGLGPENYGSFAFLLASFIAFRALLDMGSSQAFFSFISKRKRSKAFLLYYIVWLSIQFVFPLILIALIAPDHLIETLWKGESKERIIISFIAVFLQQQIWQTIAQIGESQRLTVKVQIINITIAAVHLLIISMFYWMNSLTIERVYYFIILEFSIAAFVAWLTFPIKYEEEKISFQKVISEYSKYCMPLIPYAWFGVLMSFTDTWLLQHYGGAVQQSFYSISAQFGAVSLIATASVLRIFWKEIAEANYVGDHKKVRKLYNDTTRILFMVGAIVSGFFIPWSKEIIQLILGEAYIGAATVMSLMLIYPIHQALGQLNGTMFYALEMTKPYVIINSISALIATIVSYFLLASPDALIPGLGLASIGLAIKMILLQFFTVNFSIWWLCRHKQWKYSIGYQLVAISAVLSGGYLTRGIVIQLFGEGLHFLVAISISCVIYITISALIILIMPWLLNLSREDIFTTLSRIKKIIYN
jgi:O-antigen/teichoic acid export membrane protein